MFNQFSKQAQCRYSLTVGVTVVALVGSLAHGATSPLPGDLSIYRKGTAGQVTLVMMLDNSGSMGTSSYNEDYGLGSCTQSSETSPATSVPTYSRNYCNVNYTKYNRLSAVNQARVSTGCTPVASLTPTPAGSVVVFKCYTRINRVKMGMYAALDDANIKDDVLMGVGTFNDSNSGKILLPAAALGPVVLNGLGITGQRYLLKQQIAALATPYNTPTAPAFAEAAAYLLGTTTANTVPVNVRTDVYRRTSGGTYSQCSTLSAVGSLIIASDGSFSAPDRTCSTWSGSTTTTQYPNSGATAYDGTVSRNISGTTYTVYYKNVATGYPDPDSGFANSVSSSKKADGLSYQSPLPAPANRATCDGQGIYFLTDGEPNGPNNDQSLVMKAALGPTLGSTFSCTSTGVTYTALDGTVTTPSILSNAGTVNPYPAWNCIGTFANALYGNTKERVVKNVVVNVGDGITNPLYSAASDVKGAPIQTALVGFGSVFDDLTVIDPKNACKWGARVGGSGGNLGCNTTTSGGVTTTSNYGGGGFYQASSAASVTSSIKQFIDDLTNTEITPLVTGAASVPIDQLNPTGFEAFAYMRMLTPNPAATTQLLWSGNLKKYNVQGGALKDSSFNSVLNSDGTFVMGTPDPTTGAIPATTTDLWNSSGKPDGGLTFVGGTFSKLAYPVTTGTYSATAPRTIRPVFTDFSSTGTALATSTSCAATTPFACGSALMAVPTAVAPASMNDSYIQTQFNSSPLNTLSMAQRLTLLNYLGYPQSLTPPLPTTITGLQAPTSPYQLSGAMIHSLPVQISYSGTLNADGSLSPTRGESLLYGSMEGALHLVTAGTGTGSTATGGVEQMVFVPKEILDQTIASQALVQNATTATSAIPIVAPQTASIANNLPTQGVDGAWVADSAYNITRGSTSTLNASKMNVYGGLRMGGSSYYGLNILDPSNPKLLFKISASSTSFGSAAGFERMGQTWSKPVLANIRYKGVITRVMIVGGGYDVCYESPTFALNSTTQTDTNCNNKPRAAGNAVYMVDATTGALIWEATDSSAVTTVPSGATATFNANMTHSIVGRVATLDRNADGLIDHLYFADLGGQVFRADFDNASQRKLGSGTPAASKFPVRVVRIANLANATLANSPRFYEAPTVTIHDEPGQPSFIMVAVASGDRSSPLDVLLTLDGGKGITGKPVNNVYGIIDRDFIKTNLLPPAPPSTTPAVIANTALETKDITVSSLQQNPQLVSGVISSKFFGTGRKEGWYRSLSSNSAGTELSGKTPGGMKAVEEPIAITGNLLVSVFDPQGTGLVPLSGCSAKVVGETDRQRFCLPYGACLKADGTLNSSRESTTGAQLITVANHPPLMGPGIVGVALGSADPSPSGSLTVLGPDAGTGKFDPSRKLVPTLWHERQPNPSKVK